MKTTQTVRCPSCGQQYEREMYYMRPIRDCPHCMIEEYEQ